MEKKKKEVWAWFFSKEDNRCLGYLYVPYGKRDKKDLLETLGLIYNCTYDPKLIRIKWEY